MSTYRACYVSFVQVTVSSLRSCVCGTQARHSVACFLTRGDLYISWERGRDTFDRYALPRRKFPWWLQHQLASCLLQ